MHPGGVAVSTAVDEKTEGQTRSLQRVDSEAVRSFLTWVRELPAGAEVSVNDLRPVLDQHEIPTSARGGLFRRAVVEELLDPLEVTVGSYTVPVRVPSTGRSAHRATVLVYRRSDTS